MEVGLESEICGVTHVLGPCRWVENREAGFSCHLLFATPNFFKEAVSVLVLFTRIFTKC